MLHLVLILKLLKFKNMRQRIVIKDVQSEHLKMFNDRVDRLEEHTAQVIKKMEIRRSTMFHEVRTKYKLERENYQKDFDLNLKYTIKKFSEEIAHLKTTCDEKSKQQYLLIDHLKNKLQTVLDKNQYMRRQMKVLRNENKRLNESFQESGKIVDKTCLEGEGKKYLDNRRKMSAKTNRELTKFKTLYINKCFENEILNKENVEITRGLDGFDNYVVDLLLDLTTDRLGTQMAHSARK